MSKEMITGYASSTQQRDSSKCALHDNLENDIREIKDGIGEIRDTLSDGRVNFATLDLRMNNLEKIVYGAIAVGGAAFILAVVALVFK